MPRTSAAPFHLEFGAEHAYEGTYTGGSKRGSIGAAIHPGLVRERTLPSKCFPMAQRARLEGWTGSRKMDASILNSVASPSA